MHVGSLYWRVTIRSIAVGKKGHRLGLRKELKCDAVTTKDSVTSMRIWDIG